MTVVNVLVKMSIVSVELSFDARLTFRLISQIFGGRLPRDIIDFIFRLYSGYAWLVYHYGELKKSSVSDRDVGLRWARAKLRLADLYHYLLKDMGPIRSMSVYTSKVDQEVFAFRTREFGEYTILYHRGAYMVVAGSLPSIRDECVFTSLCFAMLKKQIDDIYMDENDTYSSLVDNEKSISKQVCAPYMKNTRVRMVSGAIQAYRRLHLLTSSCVTYEFTDDFIDKNFGKFCAISKIYTNGVGGKEQFDFELHKLITSARRELRDIRISGNFKSIYRHNDFSFVDVMDPRITQYILQPMVDLSIRSSLCMIDKEKSMNGCIFDIPTCPSNSCRFNNMYAFYASTIDKSFSGLEDYGGRVAPNMAREPTTGKLFDINIFLKNERMRFMVPACSANRFGIRTMTEVPKDADAYEDRLKTLQNLVERSLTSTAELEYTFKNKMVLEFDPKFIKFLQDLASSGKRVKRD